MRLYLTTLGAHKTLSKNKCCIFALAKQYLLLSFLGVEAKIRYLIIYILPAVKNTNS